ncbi:MAG: Ca2+-dependent phosphoinositide-specific phospholipase C, partial [Polyangiaceae bacterium]
MHSKSRCDGNRLQFAADSPREKGHGLSTRRLAFLPIFVAFAGIAGCSGDETNPKPPPSCTTGCVDAGRDLGAAEDVGETDVTATPDTATPTDTAIADARDAAPSDGNRTDANADSSRPPDAAIDNPRPPDATDGSPPLTDVARDVPSSPEAGLDSGGVPPDAGDLDDLLRFNDIQMEGTHNSYHIETTGGIIPAWAYTHKPLDEQLSTQGVRQFELDIHYNAATDWPVHHVFADSGSTCKSLGPCLTILKTWSDAHPRHAPLVVLLEQKDDLDVNKIAGHYDELDAMLLSVWPRDRIITPDDVRGQRATLREAVTTDGWPTLRKSRGRILFAFIGDSTEYMMGHPNLENRVVFPRANVNDAFAAFVLMDNAQGGEA